MYFNALGDLSNSVANTPSTWTVLIAKADNVKGLLVTSLSMHNPSLTVSNDPGLVRINDGVTDRVVWIAKDRFDHSLIPFLLPIGFGLDCNCPSALTFEVTYRLLI